MSVEGVALERLGEAGGEIAAGAIVMRRALYKLQRRVDVMERWLRDVEGAGWSLKMEMEIDISSVQSISTTKPFSYHPGTPAHFPSKPVPLQSMASTYVSLSVIKGPYAELTCGTIRWYPIRSAQRVVAIL